MSQQDRTVRLDQPGQGDDPSSDDVLIAALGWFHRARAGQSVRDTLLAAGIDLPAVHQTLRVNQEEVGDFRRTLSAGDKVTIVNRVVGGWAGSGFLSS